MIFRVCHCWLPPNNFKIEFQMNYGRNETFKHIKSTLQQFNQNWYSFVTCLQLFSFVHFTNHAKQFMTRKFQLEPFTWLWTFFFRKWFEIDGVVIVVVVVSLMLVSSPHFNSQQWLMIFWLFFQLFLSKSVSNAVLHNSFVFFFGGVKSIDCNHFWSTARTVCLFHFFVSLLTTLAIFFFGCSNIFVKPHSSNRSNSSNNNYSKQYPEHCLFDI